MIQTIKASDRFHADNGWLSTYWLFSFDYYYDPHNVAFGALRVFNDDVIQAESGFGMHGHKDMEIVTYVLDGALTHKDSTGGEGQIAAGEVQRMTAGSGIRHSEYNQSKDTPVHLMQMWVLPNQTGLQPSYEQQRFTNEDRTGVLLPIASGQGIGKALTIHQDVTFYVARIRPQDKLSHQLGAKRRAFLYVIDGAITVNDERFSKGDQGRITATAQLDFQADQQSEIILIDLP
ncbi:MAG: pirin family protein [Acidobacteria bacterium]|nr:pirin family protein [Acidobacteriota bacterium]